MAYGKRQFKKKITLGFIAGLFVVFLVMGLEGGLMSAGAFQSMDIQCGDTIGPHERVKLTDDIGPCEKLAGPALTVIGPAALNLNGQTVACEGLLDENNVTEGMLLSEGILLKGKGAVLINGTVIGCDNAVVVDGEGHHRIRRINAEDNLEVGFYVLSDNSIFLNNKADMNGDDGFYVEGHGNKFILNKIFENGDEGLEIAGNKNKVVGNRAISNATDSYEIDGNENKLIFNSATFNEDEGYEVDGNRNILAYNRAVDNGGTGFKVEGDENIIKANRAKRNKYSGILVQYDAKQNRIVRNFALDNSRFDMEDEKNWWYEYGEGEEINGPEANTWRRNRFETSNQDYIE